MNALSDAIATARELLQASARLVTFSGAGLSAESGVPTFRSGAHDHDNGDAAALWSKYDPMALASPQGFAADPEAVIAWYAWRRRTIARAAPNPAHCALATLPEALHITQNVDDLLERAGARPDAIVHLHGTIAADRCHGPCGYEEPIDLANPPDGPRTCPACGDRLRPGVVWFGESLPAEAWTRARTACLSCDVLLVVGTSAAVYPAAGLIGIAREAGARIIIVNPEPTSASDLADVELLAPAGNVLPGLFEQ